MFDRFENDSGTVFRDVIFLALLGFLAIVLLLLPWLNPPAEQNSEIDAQGDVVVEIGWPAGNTDVDLWVQAPGDIPVGYSNKGGAIFNLLRDDLGEIRDPLPGNMEISVARSIPDGEWTINVHMYRGQVPVTVTARMLVRNGDVIIDSKTTTVNLTYAGQEITVFRFTTANKAIMGWSSIPKQIRDGL